MYDRVGLYRGKKSLCCVNNSKRHLTKRFMGRVSGLVQVTRGDGAPLPVKRRRVFEQPRPQAGAVAHVVPERAVQ